MIGKRHKKWIACAMAGILLVQSYPMADAAELAGSMDSVSENTVGENVSWEKTEEETTAERETVQETEAQETAERADTWSEETVSQNSISENSTAGETAAGDSEPLENTTEESVSENTAEESVSENTTEESVSENTAEESVSENTAEESVSENTAEESVSENTTEESVSGNGTQETVSANTMSADSTAAGAGSRVSAPPAAPVIKSIVPKDTTAEIRFTHLLEESQSTGILYEVQLVDEVNGEERTLSGKETGTVSIGGYDGRELNTFRMDGLSANKKYSVVLRAKYGDAGESVTSAKKTFTTKKDMLATDGSMKIRYADMETLKNDRTKKPEEVPADGVAMNAGESCALYAQVSRLMRAVETDKLKWTITPLGADSPKNGLKVKASKSTYEAVLTAETPGRYQVTATNTLSKETAAVFQVTVK